MRKWCRGGGLRGWKGGRFYIGVNFLPGKKVGMTNTRGIYILPTVYMKYNNYAV